MSPFFAASMNPMSRSACSVGDSKPARTSIRLTVGISRIDRVEDPHLVRDVIDIDNIGHVRVEALQRASWYFGVECANAQLLAGKIV